MQYKLSLKRRNKMPKKLEPLTHHPALPISQVFNFQQNDRGRDRTCNLLIRSQAPCHWATRPIGSLAHNLIFKSINFPTTQQTSCLPAGAVLLWWNY